jgi:flagellar biosynthesis/type III secretory pathway protein FliH
MGADSLVGKGGGMKIGILLGLTLLASSVAAQLNPNIIMQNSNPARQYDPTRSMEQAQRIRLMQEQECMMAAQREALDRQGKHEEQYKQGFEDGLKKGFGNGSQGTFKDFQANYPMIETNAVRNMASAVFTLERPDDFRNLIDQT